MPSPAATVLTRRHRRELALVAGLVVRRVAAVAAQADTVDIDGWWERQGPTLERAVGQGATVAATLGSRYMRSHSSIEGVTIDPVRGGPDSQQIATSLRVRGPVAFKTHMSLTDDPALSRRTMVETLQGAAQRLTLAADRDTIMDTVNSTDRIVGYRRVTSGSPCAFCSMLASRGAVYSEASVDFQAHDHDACSPEPLYQVEPEPASVLALRDEWDEATAGLSGMDALNAFRQVRTVS